MGGCIGRSDDGEVGGAMMFSLQARVRDTGRGRRLSSSVLVLLSSLALMSCDAEEARSGSPTEDVVRPAERRLSGRELQAVLAGTEVELLEPPADAVIAWRFGCAGEWMAVGGQTGRVSGSYAIETDRYCTEHSGIARQCNAVYRTSRGGYLIELDAEPGVTSPGSLYEATITVVGSACRQP